MHYVLLLLCCLCSITNHAQSSQLALNYMEQGEYEKARITYEKLYKKFPKRHNYLFGIVEAHQQLEQYIKAEVLLEKKIVEYPKIPQFLVELGHNYQLLGHEEMAAEKYQKAIDKISDSPNYAASLGILFEKYNLLDQAALVYKKAMALNPNINFNSNLARIYGQQGNLEQMFDSYLELIHKNPAYFNKAQHVFSQFISQDPLNDANSIFRKLLLRKLQQEPNILYNEMLSWLFVQQKDFKKAFSQEKAIYKRSDQGFQGLIDLAKIAIAANENDTAITILKFVIASPSSRKDTILCHQMQQQLRIKTAKKQDIADINAQYEKLFENFGKNPETLELQIDYGHFLAFEQDRKQEAIRFLKKVFKQRLSRFQDARVRMELADILVLDEKFNEGLIYYTQIQNAVKNNVLAQEARFKVAKTSYYKGDFPWAQTQLDVLKGSTTQLIANDAMELSLIISDNSLKDSTQTALKIYAKADLLSFQNKTDEAIALYDQIKAEHKGEKIEDEALFSQAKLYKIKQMYEEAKQNYLKIITYHGDDILADDAYFFLAELYANQLDNPDKAKEHFEKIIFNHADSIYFVEARKKYRALRGDAIN